MPNYDQLQRFVDYVDKEEWRKYLEEQLIPFWSYTLRLRDFCEDLKSEFQNIPLVDVSEQDLTLVLGGVVPQREEVYRRNSLARFYSNFFGLKMADLQSWLLGGSVLGTELNIIVEDTTFTRFVNQLFGWLDGAVRYQTLVDYEEPFVEYIELKKQQEKLKVLVYDFYQACLGISVNYNYHTFFLWSLKNLPYKFMRQAYPRIDQVIDFLQQEFGLRELAWTIPFGEESYLRKDYTLWGFPEYDQMRQGKSLGGALCKVNEVIWDNVREGYSATDLEKILLTLFSRVPDLKKEYAERVKERVIGNYYSNIYYRGLSAAADRLRVGFANKSIMEMLDELSPHLFLGLAKINYVGDDYLSFTRI